MKQTDTPYPALMGQRSRVDAADLEHGGGSFFTMAKWKTFMKPPYKGQRIIVLYWCPQGSTYNMDIQSWHGWSQVEMEDLHSGDLTYPVAWTEAPDYPSIPDQDIPNNG